MECNFYVQIKDENGKQKICHIENICDGYDDLHNELSKYAWSGKSIYIACMITDTNKTEFYFYDDGNCTLIDRIPIDVLNFAELKKFAQSGKFFDGVTWQPWRREEIYKEDKSVIETYGTKCNFYIRLGNSNSFAHIEHLFDTDFDLTIATSGKSIGSRYIAEYKYSIGKKNPTGIYIYEKIDKNNKTCTRCGYSLLLAPLGTKDFDKNFTYKDLKKYRNSGKCFNNYSWVDFVSDTIQIVNKKEPEEKLDQLNLWEDVNIKVYTTRPGEEHRIIYTIRKKFSNINNILFAEVNKLIEPQETILLSSYNNDDAYIISYSGLELVEMILPIEDKDAVYALKTADSKQFGIAFTLSNKLKAYEYLDKYRRTDVFKCAIIESIIHDMRMQDIKIYDTEYTALLLDDTKDEEKHDLWKDVDYTAWIAFQDDTPGITITKQFNSVADIREAEDHHYISNDEDIILVKDNTAYIISYAFSKDNIDYIFVLDQKDILKVLENNNSIKSPIVFNLYTTSSCKADEYMAAPDVCVTIKDILSNVILSTVTIYDLRYEGIHQGINTIEESKSDYSIKDIESVKFDPPYTFVVWKDNTIVFHKAVCNELFDKRQGLAICIAQKALGDDFEDVFKKFTNEDSEED